MGQSDGRVRKKRKSPSLNYFHLSSFLPSRSPYSRPGIDPSPRFYLLTWSSNLETKDMADMNDPFLRSVSETKAKYVRLGKSGLYVSVPILGTMSFGNKDWQPWVIEEEEALPILKAAYDRGVNTWNTANVYSNGISEELIGKVCLEEYV